MENVQIKFVLNGETVEVSAPPSLTLLKLLRERLGLTGSKPGCERGECGACTVLLDGDPVNSCLILAPQVEGREVITIEGLSAGDKLDPIQEAFISESAVQCGYCIPGMILSAKALLNRTPTRAGMRSSGRSRGTSVGVPGMRRLSRRLKYVAPPALPLKNKDVEGKER